MNTELSKTEAGLTKQTDDKFDRVLRWCRDDRPDTDPQRVRIPADLEKQFHCWNLIYGLLNSGRYGKTSQQISAIMKAIPGISNRTARNYLADTKRFFSVLDAPNLAFERVALIDELRDTMKRAKRKGDYRSLAPLMKLYAELIGADKPEETTENKTVINVLNYNPVNLGAQVMDEDKLDALIKRITEADRKKAENLFDEYTDVSKP